MRKWHSVKSHSNSNVLTQHPMKERNSYKTSFIKSYKEICSRKSKYEEEDIKRNNMIKKP